MQKKYAVLLCALAIVLVTLFFNGTLHNTIQNFVSNTHILNAVVSNSTSEDLNNTSHSSTQSSSISTAPQAAITTQECTDFFNKKTTAPELELHKQYQLTEFFRKLKLLDYPDAVAETIGDMAGVDIAQISNATTGFNVHEFANQIREDSTHRVFIPADDFRTQLELNIENLKFIDEVATSKNYNSLFQAIKDNTLDPSHNFLHGSVLAEIIKKDPNISSETITQLLDAGFKLNLDAIVFAIKQNLSSNIIIEMSDRYQGDFSKTWDENLINNNLTLEAAKNLRPDLIKVFTEKGVTDQLDISYSNKYKRTILDVLPEPKTNVQTKTTLDIATAALQHGDRPSMSSSAERLKKWLPTTMQQAYQEQLKPNQFIDANITSLAQQLKNFIDINQQQQQSSSDIESRCKLQHNVDKNSYIKEKLNDTKSTDKFSLYDKKMIQKMIQKTMQEKRNVLIENASSASSQTEKQKEIELLSEQIWHAIQAKKFFEALRLSDKYYALTNSKDYHKVVFLSADKGKDLFDIYEALLSRNITPPEDAILKFARTNETIDYIKKLIPFGLNLHYVSEYGENALSHTLLFHDRNREMFMFLLEQGVSIKPSPIGLDPLDLALDKMDMFNPEFITPEDPSRGDTPFFVAELMRRGAPIERSHLEKIAQLKITNPAAMEYLQQLIPDYHF